MKETGIIMSGEHPRLVLGGQKTMTRRTAGLQKINENPDSWLYQGLNAHGDHLFYPVGDYRGDFDGVVKCPYGQVGDRLVIKETWATENCYNHLKPSDIPRTAKIYYLADGYEPLKMGKVRSAMFMCYWMSRARPEITGLRAERVQDIRKQDLVAEGYQDVHIDLASRWFVNLWDSLNAKRGYSFDFNPWVWVISFKEVN